MCVQSGDMFQIWYRSIVIYCNILMVNQEFKLNDYDIILSFNLYISPQVQSQ